VEEGGEEFPGEEFRMDCQGMAGCKAEEEDIGAEDEDESDHRRDALGRFFQKVEKLRISTDPEARVHGVSGSKRGNYQT
jgi:hypothetical protein